MGNALSNTVLTKIERLKQIQTDLHREKNIIRRQMQTTTIKIGFQHSKMRMLYEHQAMNQSEMNSLLKKGQMMDVAICISHFQRDMEGLRSCVAQINTVLDAIHDMIMTTNSRQVLARTGRALERANRYQREGETLNDTGESGASMDTEDIENINTELGRASTVLENTQKTINNIRSHNADRQSFGSNERVVDHDVGLILKEYDEIFLQKLDKENLEFKKRIEVVCPA